MAPATWPVSVISNLFTQTAAEMDSASATHDTSKASFHLPDLPSLLSHLNGAIAAAWPQETPTPYKRVKVLLMSWDQSDLDIEAELTPLVSVLQGLYHYDTESWKIPSRRSAAELSRKVSDLVTEYNQEGSLLIFYYLGHSKPSEQAGGSPVWFAKRGYSFPNVQASYVQVHPRVSGASCDTLLLYDCSHSIQPGETTTGKGVIETLAARGLESPDTEGPRLFTHSLVQELAHAAHTQQYVSTVELHRRLVTRLQKPSPTVPLDTYSILPLDPPTPTHTPIHALLSNTPRTITLAPLPGPQTPSVVLAPPTTAPAPAGGPDVLVACRLAEQSFDVEQWKRWVEGVGGARGISVTAVYPSFSVLVILRMPIAVWDLVPATAGISFVGYVAGRDFGEEVAKRVEGEVEQEAELEVPKVAARVEVAEERNEKEPEVEEARSIETRGVASLWPEIFGRGRSEVYGIEEEPHCLMLSDLQDDDEVTKAEKIIREFTHERSDPSERYICDEIQAFCSPASFEELLSGDIDKARPELVAIVDETSPSNPQSRAGDKKYLSHQQLLDALLQWRTRSPPPLIETEEKAVSVAKRRLVYITNLDPWTTLAVAATASQSQALTLRDFVHKHITFQPGMEVNIDPSGYSSFQLTFHLPFFAWRKSSIPSVDPRQLRSCKNISFLDKSDTSETYIYEAQVSCTVTGVDNGYWTAYAFFDTYHDGGESKRDVQFYELTKGRAIVDPLAGGRYESNPPIWTAREYFLRIMEACVRDIKSEWRNVALSLLKKIKPYTANAEGADWRRVQKISPQVVQLLEQLQQGLSGTIKAWEKFSDTDLDYFDLDEESPRSETALIIRNIENDIRDLQALEESLRRQTEIFKSFTSTLLTLDNNNNAATANALMTTGILFFPFALTALISNTPDILVVKATPARFVLVSAAVAFLTASLYLAMTNWEATRKKAENSAANVRTYLQDLKKPQINTDDVKRQIGEVWQKRRTMSMSWPSTISARYRQVNDGESDTGRDSDSHSLPI
ncbi:hypothetical protein B0T25DRAFT_618264 [Lasiosphaeria hispida]|uniref:Uncharacterized protein n=1 Tax=Lasiosphaeria hispida TaxID=260671 RepID=A0AAJ0H5L3_9PEZI|nr:hypothetical protein B0T25DRAFT_618264 [Lasiosphaeria hispida]